MSLEWFLWIRVDGMFGRSGDVVPQTTGVQTTAIAVTTNASATPTPVSGSATKSA